MTKDTKKNIRGISRPFDPFAHSPSGVFFTHNVLEYFGSLGHSEWLDKEIDKFFEETLIPSLQDFNVIVTIDRKATTILKIKKEKYPALAEKKILKSSYVGEKEEYEGENVAIFDDSTKTGKHSIDTIKTVSKAAKSLKIFCIASLKEGEENIKRQFEEMRTKGMISPEFPDPVIERQISYDNIKAFQDKFSRAICAYMMHLQIPSDKDHFYVECKIEYRNQTKKENGIQSFDFLKLLSDMGVEPFIVDSDRWDDNHVKISSHFENLDEIEEIPIALSFKKPITFKMRIFLRMDEDTLFLVPIVMNLVVLRSWKEKLKMFIYGSNCGVEEKLCEKEKEYIDPELEKHTCEECLHLNLKLRFLGYFLKEFNKVLPTKGLALSITSTRWDKVEGNYDVDVPECVKPMVIGLDNISYNIEEVDKREV